MKHQAANKLLYTSLLMMGLLGLLFTCQQADQKQEPEQFDLQKVAEEPKGDFPYQWLSSYGFFEGELNQLNPASGLIYYEPASSLFTDYAHKSRWVWIPDGKKAQIVSDELELPVGSILIKNFYYPTDFSNPSGDRRIIETRLMIHEESGWEAYPYIWNYSQTDAMLKVVGGETTVRYQDEHGKEQVINYLIPNKNQCKSCHNKDEKLVPIGVQVKHLNHDLDRKGTPKNQLAQWVELGKLEGFKEATAHPSMGDYTNESLSLETRARAYLDSNCSYCHREEGPASTSGLLLTYEESDPNKLGINKPPVAAGNGAGSFKFDIVPGEADQSILIHRMNSTQVGTAMPEIGRTTVHREGVALIRDWVNSLPK